MVRGFFAAWPSHQTTLRFQYGSSRPSLETGDVWFDRVILTVRCHFRSSPIKEQLEFGRRLHPQVGPLLASGMRSMWRLRGPVPAQSDGAITIAVALR